MLFFTAIDRRKEYQMKVFFRISLLCLPLFLILSGSAFSQQGTIRDTKLSGSTSVDEPSWPADIDPQSGFRLPLPKREDLDES